MPIKLTLNEKVEIVLLFGDNYKSCREVANIFNERHPEKRISHATVAKVLQKFKSTGNVENQFSSRPRQCLITGDAENATNLLLHVVENPKTSVSHLSDVTGISSTSVRRILKKNKFKPYKPKFISTLKERDFIVRFDFSMWVQGQIEDNRSFPKYIFFSDEATFNSNGTVSSQNCRWWATENPRFTIECRDQYSFKTNVWVGFSEDANLLGPFFFRENLNSGRYLMLLENQLSAFLDELPLNKRERFWFMQDGASVHSTQQVTTWLNNKLGENWIGRRSRYFWPPRSPDLTPLDFWFWGYVKMEVYKQRPFENIDELEQTIREVIGQIPLRFISHAIREFSDRTITCIERDGRHTEM